MAVGSLTFAGAALQEFASVVVLPSTGTAALVARPRLVDVLGNPRVAVFAGGSAYSLPVRVLSDSDSFEVIWANTSPILTEMVDVHAITDGADPEFVGNAMGEHWPIRCSELAIAMAPDAALPYEAIAVVSESGHQPLLKGASDLGCDAGIGEGAAMLSPSVVVGVAQLACQSGVSASINGTWANVFGSHASIIHVEPTEQE